MMNARVTSKALFLSKDNGKVGELWELERMSVAEFS
jgi:hypothetical protein